MPFSGVQDLSVAKATNNTLYTLASVPGANISANTFDLPLPLSLVENTDLSITFGNVLISNNFVALGLGGTPIISPLISGNFLVNWTFTVVLTAGDNTTVTAKVETNILGSTNTFNFDVTSTPITYNFTSVIPCIGFDLNDYILCVFNSPSTITVTLLSNFINITYVSPIV